MTKIKTRNEILNDVIKDGKKHPKNWRAIFGRDNRLLSNDYYVFNPEIGVYFLKEYHKNPFYVKGVGSKIARRVDEDIEAEISKHDGDFGIVQGDFKKIYKNLEKGIHPDEIFNAAIKGKKDYGLKMPIRGKATSSKNVFGNLKNELSSKQKKVDKRFEEIAEDDGLYKSYD
ncbi:MAG: hypothetical protein ACTSVB_07790 [Candidatus Heimdallarchaeaceae archaeon]